ncbi:MAG: O-antigen ligase family protein [Paraglaciecola sp.]|uniref:O-antigen ligase family protein n=1 Tax=Paraglaciecola sp. TaxID=1920173 RepID=UPI0032976767
MNSINVPGAGHVHKPFLFTSLLLLLGFIPWLHGAELVWEIMLFSALFMATFGFAIVSKQVNVLTAFTNVKLPLCLLILWFVYCCIFLIPLPVEMAQRLSPNMTMLIEANSLQKESVILTISKALTLIELAKIASVICVFCLCYLLAKHRTQQEKILKVLFYSSAVMAIYSQVNHYTNGQFELVRAIPPFGSPWDSMVRGTFSYKNQYSIYLAMTISIGFGLLLNNLKKKSKQLDLNNVTTFIIHLVTTRHIITILLLIVMLVSFFGTNSRGGSLILAIATTITLLNYSLRTKTHNFSKNKAIFVTCVVVVFSIVFFTSKSYERFTTLGIKDNGRIMLHKTALSIFEDYPLLGTGPGTYSAIQHSYKDIRLGNSAMSKHAHNDYLELLATQGVLGALLITWSLLLILSKIFYRIPDKNVSVVLGCQVSIVCILGHSFIDFNFGTLALSVYFFVIIALLLRMAEQQ